MDRSVPELRENLVMQEIIRTIYIEDGVITFTTPNGVEMTFKEEATAKEVVDAIKREAREFVVGAKPAYYGRIRNDEI